jgi:hypothetical protein
MPRGVAEIQTAEHQAVSDTKIFCQKLQFMFLVEVEVALTSITANIVATPLKGLHFAAGPSQLYRS